MSYNGKFQVAKLGPLCQKIGSGATPRGGKDTYLKSGPFSLIRSQNIHNNRFTREGLAHISTKQADDLGNVQVEAGDVLLNITGDSVARCCQAPRDVLPARVNQHVAIIRPDVDVLDPKFVRYFLVSPQMQEHMLMLAGAGATRNALTKGMIENFDVPKPDITEQRAIAQVLGALDDKIELNQRMNETLKTLAQSLFKSWFLDFDPVHAKSSGKNPSGLDVATAELFPASFQDSLIGPVPKLWKVERLDVHITADRGLSYRGDGLRDDGTGVPMHNLNSIYERGGYKHEGIKYYAGEYREKHLLEPGEMIVANTEQGFDHLLIGHAAIVPKCYGQKGIYSHHIYRVRHKPSSPFTPYYLVELFNNARWHYWISGFSNGTTINMLPKDAIEMPLLVVPPAELVKKYSTLAAAIHLQVEANLEQSHTLAKLRDTLLPKLLSGELRSQQIEQVKQAEFNIVPLYQSSCPPRPPRKIGPSYLTAPRLLSGGPRKATDEFVEAIIIAQFTRRLSNTTHPLGRKRYNKCAYFAHRKAEHDVSQHYLKKAAGPYSPWAKYQGPEKIACENGYVKNTKVGNLVGFITGEKIDEIDRYMPNYPICVAVDWVIEKFKFRKNDDLELLATVDYAALDLIGKKQPVSFESVKHIIATNAEWAAKLKREIFSDANITRALAELRTLFPGTYTT